MYPTIKHSAKYLLRFWLAVACTFVMASPLTAQESRGTITGTVTDISGAVVPGATITITNTATNTPSTTTTTDDGNYTVPFLNPGRYTVTAEATGFKRLVRQDVELNIGDKLGLDLALEAGNVSEQVTVTAENAPLIQSETATAGQVIDRRRVSELPLADGNPLTLVRLAPGVTITGGLNSGSALSNSGPSNFRVNGGPAFGNEFTLDGAPNTSDPQGDGLRVGFQPPTDAVQEFKVVTASFDAAQGHTTGGTVDFAIRSGQNRVFGTLYEFVRNDALLNANSFFLNRNPAALDEDGRSEREQRRYNRYGGTFGGPVYLPRFGEGGPALYKGQDKTFFFVSYEGIRTVTPSFETLTVPTAQQRLGDFSYLPAGQFVYDPATARQVGNIIVRDPVQCNGRVNVICPERISPIARNYLSFLPLPNLPRADGNYFGNAPGRNTYYAFVTRVDHSFNERHKIFVRYSETDRTEIDENSAGTNNGVRINGRLGTRGNRGGVLDYVWTISPTTILNLKVGYTRFVQDRFALADFDTSSSQLGFPSTTTALLRGGSVPQINLTNFSSPIEPTGFLTANRTPSFQPTVTKIAGAHTLRFGYDFRVYQQNRVAESFQAGSFTFNNEFTRVNNQNTSVSPELNRAQAVAALLLGQPSSGNLPINAALASQSRYHGVFFQDDWKVTQRLTLNLGLRYEYDEPTTERYNRNTRGFDTAAVSPVEAQARAAYTAAYTANPANFPIAPADFRVLGGLLFADDNNRGFFEADKNNFQPRLGFAYQVNEQTVVRGGFAIYALPAIFEGINTPGFTASTGLIATPNNGLNFSASLADPFPNGLLTPVGASAGLAAQLGQGTGVIVPVDRKSGQLQRYELSLQRELPGRFLVEVAYVGSRGYDLPTQSLSSGGNVDFNAVPRQYLSTSPLRDQATINFLTAEITNPFRGIEAFRGTGFFTNTTLQRQQLLRPFPQFTVFNTERYDGSSNYNSAQLSVEKRFSQGYTFQGSYTFSKFLERTTRLNPTDEDYENRLSDADVPHRVTFSSIIELPFGRNKRLFSNVGRLGEILLGGFQVQGLYLYQSGTPLTLGDVYFNGNLRDLKVNVDGSTLGRRVTSGNPVLTDPTDNVFGINLLESGFFTLPDGTRVSQNDPQLDFSNAFRIRTLPSRVGNLRNQAINQLDASLIKNVNFTETVRLQLRAELTNVFNKAQFNGPDLNPRSTNFGRVTNTELVVLPRELQLGIKLIF